MVMIYGASGIYPTPRGQPSNVFTLQAGASRLIPSGTWQIGMDGYSDIQEYDPVQNQWINCGGSSSDLRYVNSDGNNYRVVNQQGCVVGVSVTTAGSAYTSAPVVAFGAGSAAGTVLVGGAVSTSPSVTNGGAGYTYPPLIFLDPPPTGAGLQATGYATLTTGAVSSITIDNQGAGYTNVPNIYIIPDPRDTGPTTAASAVATLTGSQTVTGVLITNYGTPLTTLPSTTFTGGGGSSAAGTAIMVRSIGAYTVTTAGSGYSGTVLVQAFGNGGVASPANTNPKWTTNLVRTRSATLIAAYNSTGGLTATGQSVVDGGIFGASSPTIYIAGTTFGGGNAVGVVGVTWANNNSTIQILPV